jgi:N-acetylmuramoyl-L-alanine amidase
MGTAGAFTPVRRDTGDPHPRVSLSLWRRSLTVAGAIALALAVLLAAASGAEAATKKKKSTSKKKTSQSTAASSAKPVARSIRSYTGPESTRLVLELSKAASYRVEHDSLSRRVILHVANAVRSPGLEAPSLDDGAVRGVIASEEPDGFRLDVQLEEWTPPHVFGADGETGSSARVVLDVPRPGQAERDAAEAERIAKLSASGQRIVVIDPGHGGEASGAVGRVSRTMEKDVTLAIARRLARELEARGGVKVILTRDGDYDVPLRERYRVAERYQADAFVSIHTNSSPGRRGSGTEVYFLTLKSASDEQSKALADIENAADRISAGAAERTDNELVGILLDLRQSEVLQQSSFLAEAVLNEIESGRKLEARGVKQAAFAVLKSPVVPSVLVETAFINNPAEERLLKNPDFQQEMAGQIARGVLSYLSRAPAVSRGREGS